VSREDQEIRQLLLELRALEGSGNILQSRLDILNAAISEVTLAHATLEGIKTQPKGADILIPLGAGSFLRASLSDVERVIIGIGAGVAVEKTVDESIAELKNRLEDLEKARVSIQQQLGGVLSALEEKRTKLSELVGKKGGGTVTVL
jgi:prefoldin alpha subunit